MRCDTLIIGGGVIGLSIARALHKRGQRKIFVVDKSEAGSEASWAAAGMLGPQAETDELGPFFEMCHESRDMYPGLAADLLRETGVDVELDRTGTLALAFDDQDAAELLARYRRQRDAGLEVELLSSEEVQRLEPFVSASVQMGLFFPGDWQVENRILVEALLKYARLNGINIREHTAVERLIVENGRITGAEVDKVRISARATVVATGAWTSLIKVGHADMPFAVEPVRGQIVCLRTDAGRFKHVIHSRRGYLVPRADGRILAGSTSEHAGFENVVTENAVEDLRNMAIEISPFLDLETHEVWSGLRPFIVDGYPVLGALPGIRGVLIATAHYRNGILLAPLTAEIVAENIVGGVESKYLKLFAADRFSKRSVGTAGEK